MTDDRVYDLPSTISKPAECDDAVSRKAVMQALIKLGYGDEENGADAEYMSALWDVAKEIESLPPVTPNPKTGKWIKHDTGHSIYYDCSLCGCLAPCTETADAILWKMANYCPDCGAKMEGVSE